MQGTESIGNASKLGLMEMLTLVKDTSMCTRRFTEDEVTRQFSAANAQGAIAASGSSERHHRPNTGTPKKPKLYDPIADAIAARLKRETPPQDQQLNLFEFVNFLVRCGFWRANPQWGSKYNRRDLTPVPESVQMLLDGFLPRAKRDTSHEFRKVLANDAATQAALGEYRERLHDWLRLALRKDSGKADALGAQPTKLTYGLWIGLMDGPDAEQQKAAAARAACPKMVGEWAVKQESEITGDERVAARVQETLTAKLSIPQVRWNFLRSQSIEELGDGEIDEHSEYASLDFSELQVG